MTDEALQVAEAEARDAAMYAWGLKYQPRALTDAFAGFEAGYDAGRATEAARLTDNERIKGIYANTHDEAMVERVAEAIWVSMWGGVVPEGQSWEHADPDGLWRKHARAALAVIAEPFEREPNHIG